MLLRQPNWILYGVVLALLSMICMTAGRFVMTSSRALYVALMSGTAICMIGAAYCVSRNK